MPPRFSAPPSTYPETFVGDSGAKDVADEGQQVDSSGQGPLRLQEGEASCPQCPAAPLAAGMASPPPSHECKCDPLRCQGCYGVCTAAPDTKVDEHLLDL